MFYRLFCRAYTAGALLLSPWNRKARLWRSGRKKSFTELEAAFPAPAKQTIWMHCASLGEFEQGRPVLEALRLVYPQAKILLSFFSSSGYEIQNHYNGADTVVYLPMDNPENAKRFLDITRPELVLWVKYEYWYFYLLEIKKRNIPLLLISGVFREDQPFFRWYGGLHRKMLGFFSHFFVQNDASKKLLGSIGFSEEASVSGDTRFDRVIAIAEGFKPISAVEAFINSHDTVVAGSTWAEDEEELDHFANTHPDIKFIIAPHEIDEDHIKETEKLFHHSIRFSNLPEMNNRQPAANVLIIDNIGMLSRLYHYATIAYIGGGFGDDGIHNALEAAVYGKPVVFGPVYEKYAEAVDLVEGGGAFSVGNALELEALLKVLLKSGYEYTKAAKAAGDYVYSSRGATVKITGYIQEKRLLTSW
jgi:3-deoxy-D-manno-octulosonic-acid transferase